MNKNYSFNNITGLAAQIYAFGIVVLFAIVSLFTLVQGPDLVTFIITFLAKMYYLVAPLIYFFSICLIVCNMIMLYMPGKKKQHYEYLLAGTFFLLVIIIEAQLYRHLKTFVINKGIKDEFFNVYNIYVMFMGAVDVLVWYYESLLLSIIHWTRKVSNGPEEYDRDFIIVLGCGLTVEGLPTVMLKQRLDRAYEFYYKQIDKTGKQARFVLTGGQGADEPRPEAVAMKEYLVNKGIDPNLIFTEEQSTNTYENLKNAREFVNDIMPDVVPKSVFCTTNYHVFRSGVIAQEMGLKAFGIGSHTWFMYWPDAIIREFFSILKAMDFLKLNDMNRKKIDKVI